MIKLFIFIFKMIFSNKIRDFGIKLLGLFLYKLIELIYLELDLRLFFSNKIRDFGIK